MSTTQLSLFGEDRPTLREILDEAPRTPATDPNVRAEDAPRLATQNERILARLREGPATAAELAGIALKYTSRISDLRAAGHDIRLFSQWKAVGQQVPDVYVLFG